MKKLVFAFAIVLSLATSCVSNEKKANKLIDSFMKEHLYVYDSYKPVTTTLDTIGYMPMFDVEVIDCVKKMDEASKAADLLKREIKLASSKMALWSSSGLYDAFSNNQISQAREDYNTAFAKLQDLENTANAAEEKMQSLIMERTQTDNRYFLVKHNFRSKNRLGMEGIQNFFFVTDLNFENIIYAVDAEDEETLRIVKLMGEIIEGWR